MHPSHPQRRLGLGMLALAWLVGLALLALVFQQRLDREHNPNPQPEARRTVEGGLQVVLAPNRQHHYVTGATINGQPVVLLVDTGARNVVIPARIAATMYLPRLGRGHAIHAYGRTRELTTRLTETNIRSFVLIEFNALLVSR